MSEIISTDEEKAKQLEESIADIMCGEIEPRQMEQIQLLISRECAEARLEQHKNDCYSCLNFAEGWGDPDCETRADLERELAALDAAKSQMKCLGYPECDGELPGEPHEPECPMFKKGEADGK